MQKKNYYTTRRADGASLKDCIGELLDAYKLRGKLSQTHIIASWEKLMGQSISKRTSEIFFKDNTLFIKITSAPLKQELQLSKTKIIKLLNEEVGTSIIDNVVFL